MNNTNYSNFTNSSTNFNSQYVISEKKIEILNDEVDAKPLYYIEVKPSSTFSFDYILIKNYYTHMINIIQFANNKWKCILSDYKIMQDPECDEDSEKYFVINCKKLIENGLSYDAELMRFYLTQDSTIWKDFYLSEIKFIKEDNLIENNTSIIKYSQNDNRFEFELEKNNFVKKSAVNEINEEDDINRNGNGNYFSKLDVKNSNKIVLLNDKEEISQKYIEIIKLKSTGNLNVAMFK